MKRAFVNEKIVYLCIFLFGLFITFRKVIPLSWGRSEASSTVNQTAMRGLVTNIIQHSSGGISI